MHFGSNCRRSSPLSKEDGGEEEKVPCHNHSPTQISGGEESLAAWSAWCCAVVRCGAVRAPLGLPGTPDCPYLCPSAQRWHAMPPSSPVQGGATPNFTAPVVVVYCVVFVASVTPAGDKGARGGFLLIREAGEEEKNPTSS